MNLDDRIAHRHALLERIVRRYEAALDLCDTPIPLKTSPNWTMNPKIESEDELERAALWDLLTLDKAHLFPIRTRWHFDTEMEFSAPSEMARQFVVHRSYDPNELFLLDQLLASGMTLVDVGSNFGAYTIFAARKVGTAGQVISFEPSRRELSALRRNVELNRLTNVRVMPHAVADVETTATFSEAPIDFAGHNRLGDLMLFSTMPTLRLTTDRKNYHWMSVNNGVTIVPVGKAGALEVLLYSDEGFEFLLDKIEVLPQAGRIGPWLLDGSDEARLEIPSRLADAFAALDARFYGNLQVTGFDRLELRGEGKAGAVFRCLLDPTREYTLTINGRGRPAPPHERYPVGVVTLDSQLLYTTQVDAVKVDVEGAEMRVLRGAVGIVEKFHPVFVVEVVDEVLRASGSTAVEVYDFLSSRGYTLFDVATGTPRLIDRSGRHGSNVIAVPERFLDAVLRLAGLDRRALTASCAES